MKFPSLTEEDFTVLRENMPDWEVSQIRYGQTNQPVIIIDNFSPHAKRLIETSRTAKFGKMNPHYPGVQAAAPSAYLTPLGAGLGYIITNGFDFPGAADLQLCAFSYVTTPPDALSPLQRYPHYDGGHNRKMALLHYLCDEAHGGTSFYRHDRTGFEIVTRDRDAEFAKAREADVAEFGLKPSGYVRDSGDGFTRLAHVPARFNRAIIYSSTTLHSGDLGDSPTFSASPEDGRLTVNTFLVPA